MSHVCISLSKFTYLCVYVFVYLCVRLLFSKVCAISVWALVVLSYPQPPTVVGTGVLWVLTGTHSCDVAIQSG